MRIQSMSIYFAAVLPLLTACIFESDIDETKHSRVHSEGISLNAPKIFSTNRNIDFNNIWCELYVNGDFVSMSNKDGVWTGSVSVDQNEYTDLSITWFENYNNITLGLARMSTAFYVAENSSSYSIQDSEYEDDASLYDYDNDGRSNLSERLAGTDPTVFDSTDNEVGCTSGNCDAIIPRVSSAPTIDGFVDGAWSNSASVDLSGAKLLINNLLDDSSGNEIDQSASHSWRAMHDGVYIYLLAEITGSFLYYDSDRSKPWLDDSLDLYFDGNNSNSSNYDNIDDYHIVIPFMNGSNAETSSSNGKFEYGTVSKEFTSTSWPEIGWATRYQERSGDVNLAVYELRFKLSSIGAEVGELLGFEIQTNDDDDGGNRDAKWGWSHPSGYDNAQYDPSLMGTVLLGR